MTVAAVQFTSDLVTIFRFGLGLTALWVDHALQRLFHELQKIQSELVQRLGLWGTMFAVVSVAVLSVVLYLIIYYRGAIRKRVRDVEQRLALGIIYRDTTKSKPPKKVIRALELHPSLLGRADNVMSLGQYLSSLRINPLESEDGGVSSLPRFVERELEATIASMLLQNFGPRLGGALLPMLGISKIDSWIAKISAGIATYVASYMLVEASQQWDPTEDKAVFPFSVSEIVSFVNLNQKFRWNPPDKTKTNPQEAPRTNTAPSPLTWMSRGEIGYSPTFASGVDREAVGKANDTKESCIQRELLPNPFIVNDHFEAAILGLEDRIRAQTHVTAVNPGANAESATTSAAYDPNDRSLPEPVPINERVLPGLHMGWGDAKCTHTKREIVRNRLLACLLTKLSCNYSLVEKSSSEELFIVEYEGVKCRFPDEFIEVLMRKHTIEVCPRTTITTFGIAACVKEGKKWINIPLALFFRTGYEQWDGKPAYFAAPHGGMDLSIKSGPLLGNYDGGKLDIQFYVAIEGMCGWHSNHNVDVPWVKAVPTTKVYSRAQTIQAVRLAGLLATTFNALATEMELPFGGYGVLGVCNDSAAFIDFALRGETNMYPLISTGRFLFHCAHRLQVIKNAFSQDPSMAEAVRDLGLLLTAACNMDSDIHSSPGQLIGATRRYLVTNPQSYFQLTEDSKSMMTNLAAIYHEFSRRADNKSFVKRFLDKSFAKKKA